MEQQGQNEESEVVIADSNGKVFHKESEKENDIDKREAFHYDDVIDYKKPLKKDKRNLMVGLENGLSLKMMDSSFMIWT